MPHRVPNHRRRRAAKGERLFERDALHGEIEVYNARGRHLGVVDPVTGTQIKPAVKGGASMSEPTDFLTRLTAGTARPDDIDDHIDAWHDGPGTQELHEFLGMTEAGYATWLRHPEALAEICRPRQPPRAPQPRRQVKRGLWTRTTATVIRDTQRYRTGHVTAASRIVVSTRS